MKLVGDLVLVLTLIVGAITFIAVNINYKPNDNESDTKDEF